jgi:germination protein M
MAKQKATFGCLFWLALVLLVIVIFLFNQKNIETVLKETNFLNLINHNDEPVQITINQDPDDNTEENNNDEPPDVIKIDTVDDTVDENDEDPEEIQVIEEDEMPNNETNEIPENSHERKNNLRNATIYFVKVNQEGNIIMEPVVRPVYYDNSPLKETLLTLLNGWQTTSEVNQGLYTMIPQGTKLIDVFVNDTTAYIDFSEDFLFNPLGQDGLKAQLQQVVYTATEFSNIKEIQFLIEGEIRSFLNTEGIYIGEPLSRNSF